MNRKPKHTLLIKRIILFVIAIAATVSVINAISSLQKSRASRPVIGDLGGVPVSIPKPFAHFVEYDNDPHFMDKEGWVPPQRTYQSKLRSFGFEVRFPDMASEAMKTDEERLKKDIFNTMWMRVGVKAGEAYGSSGDVAFERYLENYLNPNRKRFIYAPLPNKTYGLTGYTPIDVDKSLRGQVVGGASIRDKNLYYEKDKDGHITTFIECGNKKHRAVNCRQFFNLRPLMKVRVRVSYRKELLPHWREIQASVSQVFYGFQVDSKP